MRFNKTAMFVAIGLMSGALLLRNQLTNYYSSATTKVRQILDSNDLWAYNGEKFVLNPTDDDVVIFAQMDLGEEDMAFELSKLAFMYHWREFVRQNTRLSTHIILSLINDSPDKVETVKAHLIRFNNELRMMRMEPLSIGIQKSNKFRTKHGIEHEDQIVLFRGSGTDTYPLETIGSIYNPSCLAFINGSTDFFLKLASKALADPEDKQIKPLDSRTMDPILELMSM